MNRRDAALLTPLAIIFSTVLVTRAVTIAGGNRPSPIIAGIQTHHWMWGLGLFYVGLLRKAPVMSYVGLGLMVDEADQIVTTLFPSYASCPSVYP